MGKKLDEYRKQNIKFFGFSFARKSFWIGAGAFVGGLALLLILTLCGVEISWYGVMFGMGFIVALILACQLCKERDINEEYPYSLIWWVFPFAIIGARLYFCIFSGVDEFMDIIRIWDGGLAVYGGVIGGFLGLVISGLIHKVSIIKTTDIVAPVLALGQAFGRIGCIFGHCCYGIEVTKKALQWFPIALYVDGGYHYATNLYESILDLALFFGLTILLRKVKITGVVTLAYMFGYGLVRFILEAFRDVDQTLFIGGFPVSQLLSIILVVVGAVGICVLLLVNNKKGNRDKSKAE